MEPRIRLVGREVKARYGFALTQSKLTPAMSRTERLLDLIQLLRRHRAPVPGPALADELGVSIRTLYRDIATLQAQGADIEGEPGLGA